MRLFDWIFKKGKKTVVPTVTIGVESNRNLENVVKEDVPEKPESNPVGNAAVHKIDKKDDCPWDRIKANLEWGFSYPEAMDHLRKWANDKIRLCIDIGTRAAKRDNVSVVGTWGSDGLGLGYGYKIYQSIKSEDKIKCSCVIVNAANMMQFEQMIIYEIAPEEMLELFHSGEIIEKSKPVWLELAKICWEEYD